MQNIEALRTLLENPRYKDKTDEEILFLINEKIHDPSLLPIASILVSDADILGGVTNVDIYEIFKEQRVIQRGARPGKSKDLIITRPDGQTFVWFTRANWQTKKPPDVMFSTELTDEEIDALRIDYANDVAISSSIEGPK